MNWTNAQERHCVVSGSQAGGMHLMQQGHLDRIVAVQEGRSELKQMSRNEENPETLMRESGLSFIL